MRDVGAHVNYFGEVNPGCYLLVQPRRMLKPWSGYCILSMVTETLSPFQVEWGNDRQLLHCQLLGALLVWVALVAPGFWENYRSVCHVDGLSLVTFKLAIKGCHDHQPDFGHWAKVFCLSKSVEAEVQGNGGSISNCWQVQWNVPERINCCWDTLAHLHVKMVQDGVEWNILKNLADNIRLEFSRKYCVNDASAWGGNDAWR